MSVRNRLHHWVCVCGEPATTVVEVDWAGGARRYRYCAECAEDITTYVDGTEEIPS